MEDSEAEMPLIQYLRDCGIDSHLQQSGLLALHFLPTLFLHSLAQLDTGAQKWEPRGASLREQAWFNSCYTAQDKFLPPKGHSALPLRAGDNEAATGWLRKQIQAWQHLRAFWKLLTLFCFVLFIGP